MYVRTCTVGYTVLWYQLKGAWLKSCHEFTFVCFSSTFILAPESCVSYIYIYVTKSCVNTICRCSEVKSLDILEYQWLLYVRMWCVRCCRHFQLLFGCVVVFYLADCPSNRSGDHHCSLWLLQTLYRPFLLFIGSVSPQLSLPSGGAVRQYLHCWVTVPLLRFCSVLWSAGGMWWVPPWYHQSLLAATPYLLHPSNCGRYQHCSLSHKVSMPYLQNGYTYTYAHIFE